MISTELLALQAHSKAIRSGKAPMLNVTNAIPGVGFFPGAYGSFDPSVPISDRHIMVLGQDQDRVAGFKLSLIRKGERYSPTWKNLELLFGSAGIPLEACFFTNFIMGIRLSSCRSTGPSPALAHPVYMRSCVALFLQQLVVQRPRLIITLGMIPFQLLTLVSEDLRYRALGIGEFKELDARDMLINEAVKFDTEPGITTTVVPITHPCQPQNSKGRTFIGKDGLVSEVEVLRQAMARSGIAG